MTNATLVQVCLVSAGATLGTGVLAAGAHAGNRENDYYLPYSVSCLGGTMLFLALAALYGAESLDVAVAALRWHITAVALTMPAVVWLFARIAQRPTERAEMLLLATGSALVIVANAFAPATLHFQSIAAAPPGTMVGGRVVVYAGHGGWITAVYHAWNLFPVGLCLVNGLYIWRKRERALGAMAILCGTVFFFANVIATITDFRGGPPAYLGGVPLLFTMIMLLGLMLGFNNRRQRSALLASDAELRGTNARLRDEIAMRARLEERVIESQRLEALGRMATGVAHDFNNVLTVVGGHADLLRQRLSLSEADARSAEAIGSAVERGAGLTRQLLAFARRQQLAPTAVDPDALVLQSRDLLIKLAGPATRIALELGAEGQAIHADPTQFAQVLMNLAANARDAMPAGGQFSIATRRVAAGAHDGCACEGAIAAAHVAIDVRDTGSGIEAATLPRIFEPFFTTKAPDKGTGLGLATVHGIVQQSGAHIAVSSRVGEGTHFRICWPAESVAAEVAAADAAAEAEAFGGQ